MRKRSSLLLPVALILCAIALSWTLSHSMSWLGQFPGDIVVERVLFRFYFLSEISLIACVAAACILWSICLNRRAGKDLAAGDGPGTAAQGNRES
jgi:Protein of unknown function (DUF2905)